VEHPVLTASRGRRSIADRSVRDRSVQQEEDAMRDATIVERLDR